jgi:distribution and morphology protein 10
MFKTTQSLNALPSLSGSLGYIFTSCDLQLESSTAVKLQDVIQHFRVYGQPRTPEPRAEIWQSGERIDKRGRYSSSSNPAV